MTRRGPAPLAELDAADAGLKPFQRRTVDAVVAAMFDAEHPQRRFLVADEVGLGKTKVARSVVAETVRRLWDDESTDRIDIVYICSNHQIARQNVADLNVLRGAVVNRADRLTMLPAALADLDRTAVNVVAFTPDTSLRFGYARGRVEERAMLFHLLAQPGVLGAATMRRPGPRKLLALNAKSFDGYLDQARKLRVPAHVATMFRTALEDDGLIEQFSHLTDGRRATVVSDDQRSALVGRLRRCLARACVRLLTPDLVILDEFQRFTNILDGQGEDGELANLLFSQPTARVLLLSATPYTMLTGAGDDQSHQEGFTRTVKFLLGCERATELDTLGHDLGALRQGVLTHADPRELAPVRDRIQTLLRSVMVRTEKLATDPGRDGMLRTDIDATCELTASDVSGFVGTDAAARAVGVNPTMVEYWKSAPYLFNFMDDYQVKRTLRPLLDTDDGSTRAALTGAHMLHADHLVGYDPVDPRNGRLRWLVEDLDRLGGFDMLWAPPALPQTVLCGPYAGREAFTKRLVFSGWAVVPKAVAALTSLEMERRHHRTGATYDSRGEFSGRLELSTAQDRFTTLALMLPSATLARLGDPLTVARETTGALPVPIETMRATVRARLATALTPLLDKADRAGPERRLWYAAAITFLDPGLLDLSDDDFVDRDTGTARTSIGLTTHLRRLGQVGSTPVEDWGRPPDTLLDDLTDIAIAGPAVCLLRAVHRLVDWFGWDVPQSDLTRAGARLAWAFRSLVSTAEADALISAGAAEGEDFWRALLHHCVDGGLGSVLDEWFHLLPDQQRLHAGSVDPLSTVVDAAVRVLTLRGGGVGVDLYGSTPDQDRTQMMRTHLAMRFGQARGLTAEGDNPVDVRNAFNSPFRPFVLVSTSVGQEGLDFHHYAHAVVHWNLPTNPVALEQREGRVHRYKNHAVRKNVAAAFGTRPQLLDGPDPWCAAFDLAAPDGGDAAPWWVYPGTARIERLVPMLPLSREVARLPELVKATGLYRMTIGQPRQSELLEVLAGLEPDQQEEFRRAVSIDLTPDGSTS